MSTQKINPRFALLAILMVLVAAIRIPNAASLTAWSNFTPIGAMALFGGAYFNKRWKAFVFPLLTLFISDIIINQYVYEGKYGIMYSSWYWVYGGFALIVLLGTLILKKVTLPRFLTAALVSPVCYWLIVDFGVWLVGCTDLRSATKQLLPHTFEGLIQCYIQGLPYMKNFLLGTLIYGAAMFGVFEWMRIYNPALESKTKNIA